MSRIGNRELVIPEGVTVTPEGNKVNVSGKLGNASIEVNPVITVTVEEGKVYTKRSNEQKHTKQLHGTTNALIQNMMIGVSEGFKKELEINGVGYKFQVSGNQLTINAGYSHPVVMTAPEGLKLECPSVTELVITGTDKQAVGQFAAVVRDVRSPEPYKGKGIRYKNEVIKLKEGKKAA